MTISTSKANLPSISLIGPYSAFGVIHRLRNEPGLKEASKINAQDVQNWATPVGRRSMHQEMKKMSRDPPALCRERGEQAKWLNQRYKART